MIEVLNTIICYNNLEEVVQYVKKVSLLKSANKVAVAVVINKLDNGNIIDLQNELAKINILSFTVDPKTNLGYMNGMIKGYQAFKENYGTHDLKYIIMSNTDINYPDDTFISDLLLRNYSENVWSIGPAVYAPDRRNFDNPVCETRRSKMDVIKTIKIFRTPVFNEIYFHLSNLKGKIKKIPRGTSRNVYEVHGCYFVIRKELGDLMVQNPFGALLYSEESYVAEMVWHNGKTGYYDANLLVEHVEHTVTGKLDYKKLSKYIADSMEVILRDFY